MTVETERVLMRIYQRRPCWICGQVGWCQDREPQVDLAGIGIAESPETEPPVDRGRQIPIAPEPDKRRTPKRDKLRELIFEARREASVTRKGIGCNSLEEK